MRGAGRWIAALRNLDRSGDNGEAHGGAMGGKRAGPGTGKEGPQPGMNAASHDEEGRRRRFALSGRSRAALARLLWIAPPHSNNDTHAPS